MGTQARPVIQVKNLYKVYRVGDSHVRALDGVNLEIYKGRSSAPSWVPQAPVSQRF